MTSPSDDERNLQLILDDLSILFEYQRIEADQISDVEQKLKSVEVKRYLSSLCNLSKPEEALSDAFFKGNSVLSRYLSPNVAPEVNVKIGFIDFKVGTGRNSFLLELKPLFVQDTIPDGDKRRVKALKQNNLSWKDHEDQIIKYLQKDHEYVGITNLKDWVFFNDKITIGGLAPFHSTNLFQFTIEYKINKDPIDYLTRAHSQHTRGDLDKEFLASLNSWVKLFSKVKYDLDDDKRDQLIIGLINKFIFIQTLDDYRVIDFQWLRTCWTNTEKMWEGKGKFRVLQEFINEFMKWFDGYYDTELFSGDILECVTKDEKNIETFYRAIYTVLGMIQITSLMDSKGILQYDFRNINEDIFGKAYETFLANRHDEAIYYTPSYVSEFIVENTVKNYFQDVFTKLKQEISEKKYTEAKKLAEKLISLKILDPGCGSGSFLVKTLKIIYNLYADLGKYLLEEKNKVLSSDPYVSQNEDKTKIDELLEITKSQNSIELLSAILLRHIYGNDLDSKALEVARVNLWLEAIKLAPDSFSSKKLPNNSNKVLPHFDINLTNGNSVVGMPIEQCIPILQKHSTKLAEMSKLRQEYIDLDQDPEKLSQIDVIKCDLRKIIDSEYTKFLKNKKIPSGVLSETIVFHWTLEFWFMYFDDNGKILPDEDSGVDFIIGNPPYKSVQVIKKRDPTYSTFLEKSGFTSATGSFDLAAIFVEKSYDLLNKFGKFGFILTNTFFGANYGKGLRTFLSKPKAVSGIVNFGDQQVFEGASTYTAILFQTSADNIYILEKEEIEGSLTKVYSKELKSSVLLESEILTKFVKGSLDIKLCDLSYADRLIIFPYKKIDDGFRVLTFDEMTNDYPRCFEYLKKFEASLKKRADCPKTEWWGHTYPRNLPIFEKSKIMTPFNAFDPSFAYDPVGYCYTTGIAGGYAIILKASYKMDPYYLIGLLNSTLLGRYLVTKGGGTLRGGYISYEDRFIRDLPIVIPTTSIESQISEITTLTKSLEALKKARKQFVGKWEKIATKIKSTDLTLMEMLEKDKEALLQNEDIRWFEDVSFYPHEDEKNSFLEQQFKSFRLFTDSENLVIKIQGIDAENTSTTVFEFTFKDEYLMQNVYLSLSGLLNSRVSTKKLKDIFEKIKIPAVGPNPTNTVNIVKQTIEKMDQKPEKSEKPKPSLFDPSVPLEEVTSEVILEDTPSNILDIDTKISENLSKIDAYVFKLYGLEKSEINQVLNIAEIAFSKQGKILEFYDQIELN